MYSKADDRVNKIKSKKLLLAFKKIKIKTIELAHYFDNQSHCARAIKEVEEIAQFNQRDYHYD